MPLQVLEATKEVTKQCGRCGQTKAAPSYSPDNTTFDGLHPVCRMCAGDKPPLAELRIEEGQLAAAPHWLTGPAQGLALASQTKSTPRQTLSLASHHHVAPSLLAAVSAHCEQQQTGDADRLCPQADGYSIHCG